MGSAVLVIINMAFRYRIIFYWSLKSLVKLEPAASVMSFKLRIQRCCMYRKIGGYEIGAL